MVVKLSAKPTLRRVAGVSGSARLPSSARGSSYSTSRSSCIDSTNAATSVAALRGRDSGGARQAALLKLGARGLGSHHLGQRLAGVVLLGVVGKGFSELESFNVDNAAPSLVGGPVGRLLLVLAEWTGTSGRTKGA
jgi:hypothetical protein